MLTWHEVPFVRILVPYLIGLLLSLELLIPINTSFWFFFTIPVVLPLFFKPDLYRYRLVSGFLLSFSLFVLGYQLGILANPSHSELFFAKQNLAEKTLIVKLNSSVTIKKSVATKGLVLGTRDSCGMYQKTAGSILLYLENDSISRNLKIGDVIEIQSKIQEVQSPQNPRSFDFKKYMFFQGILHQSFVRQKDWRLIEHSNFSLFKIAKYCQHQLENILKKHIDSQDDLGVAMALIIGEKKLLSDEIRTTYSNTGAMHVLAVSGLHVGLIYLILLKILGLFPWYGRYWSLIKALMLLACIWAYALITGASPSVTRASIMVSFMIVGKGLKRHSNIYNILCASAFFMLLFNPFLIKQVGFQLSYCAVIGIVFFQPLIYKRITIRNRTVDHFWQLTTVSVAAQIATLPLTIYYFHKFPVYFWLSGLIVIDAAFMIIGLGIVLFFIQSISDYWSDIIGYFLNQSIHFVNEILKFIEGIPCALIDDLWISGTVVFTLYLLIYSIGLLYKSPTRKLAYTSISFLLLFFTITSFNQVNKRIQDSLVIYNHKDAFMMDVFVKGKLYAIESDSCLQGNKDYTRKGNRMFMGAKLEQTLKVDRDTLFQNESISKNGLFYHINGKRFALLEKEVQYRETKDRFEVDYLILNGKNIQTIKNIISWFTFSNVILCANVPYKNAIQITSECNSKGIDCYDIRNQGAFIMKSNRDW